MPDAVSQATDIAGGMIPSFGGAGKWLLGVGAWLVLAIVFLVFLGVCTWLFVRKLKYNKKIVIFEKVGGRFEPTRNDRAMEVKFSTAGDTIFYLRKHKKYIPNPRLQTGRRIYWYWIREDDEWINFEPGDFDADAKKLGAHFLDKEMRYARTQIQKGLKARYEKQGFWKQYGVLVFSLGFIVVLGMMMWLLFDKWIDLAGTTNAGVETAKEVLKEAARILGAIDNIKSGGGGYVPA